MATITIPMKPRDPIVKHALETLDDIQKYVEVGKFTLTGLANGLGRKDNEALRAEVMWLLTHNKPYNYLGGDIHGLMCLTPAGKMYEHPQKDSEDSGPAEEDDC